MSELIKFGLLELKSNEVDTWVSVFQSAKSRLSPGPRISLSPTRHLKRPTMGEKPQGITASVGPSLRSLFTLQSEYSSPFTG